MDAKEKYIYKTLNSVLNQTYPHFELILVDDGSVDNSGNICDQYALADSRIKVIHQKNGGVSNARNTGIKAASNNLIAFIDADDFWKEDYLERMSDLIKKFPKINIYSSKYTTVVNGIASKSEEFFPSETKYVIFDLIDQFKEKVRFPIHTSSVIIKKNAIEEVSFFDERINCFEDYDLFVRLALTSKVAYLNQEPLSFYNLDVPADSKARGAVPDLKKHWLSFMDKFEEAAKDNHNLKMLMDRAILTQLINYRRLPKYKKEVKDFIKQVDSKNFSMKYKLIYKTPVFIGDLIINAYLALKYLNKG